MMTILENMAKNWALEDLDVQLVTTNKTSRPMTTATATTTNGETNNRRNK